MSDDPKEVHHDDDTLREAKAKAERVKADLAYLGHLSGEPDSTGNCVIRGWTSEIQLPNVGNVTVVHQGGRPPEYEIAFGVALVMKERGATWKDIRDQCQKLGVAFPADHRTMQLKLQTWNEKKNQ
jgi:hypothetical protein